MGHDNRKFSGGTIGQIGIGSRFEFTGGRIAIIVIIGGTPRQ